ncbi:MAG: hypothetical protein QOC75_4438 [Pseudonocardiales bacterium]|jgi:hypothetical protein|nr:hypothetical protein [Pseudonocardiales bacterium]
MPLEPSNDLHRAEFVVRPAVSSCHLDTLKGAPRRARRSPGKEIVRAAPPRRGTTAQTS